jgi:AraC-like DNA-binding protein
MEVLGSFATPHNRTAAALVKTLETTPAGETHWSTRTMASNAGMSRTTIGRIWRTFGLKPHVTESFKLSPDPQLIEKIRTIPDPGP